MLELVVVVTFIVLACILPMAGITRGVSLMRAGYVRTGNSVVLGVIIIGLMLGAMGTHLLGDLAEANLERRLSLWGSLFGLLVLISLFYTWQFFYSPRAQRLRCRADWNPRGRGEKDEREEERDLDAYLDRLKIRKARWSKDGGVRKPKGIEKVERTGWVRNLEGEEKEEVWRVETDFGETDEEMGKGEGKGKKDAGSGKKGDI